MSLSSSFSLYPPFHLNGIFARVPGSRPARVPHGGMGKSIHTFDRISGLPVHPPVSVERSSQAGCSTANEIGMHPAREAEECCNRRAWADLPQRGLPPSPKDRVSLAAEPGAISHKGGIHSAVWR